MATCILAKNPTRVMCAYNFTFIEYDVIVVYDDVIWQQYLGRDAGSPTYWVHGAVTASDLRVEVLHHLVLVTHKQLCQRTKQPHSAQHRACSSTISVALSQLEFR